MGGSIDFMRARREDGRWRILVVLDASRPLAAAESLIWRALSDQDSPLSQNEVRRELKYLEGLGLVTVTERVEGWSALLTSEGINYVDYTSDDRPGISRPPKYWS